MHKHEELESSSSRSQLHLDDESVLGYGTSHGNFGAAENCCIDYDDTTAEAQEKTISSERRPAFPAPPSPPQVNIDHQCRIARDMTANIEQHIKDLQLKLRQICTALCQSEGPLQEQTVEMLWNYDSQLRLVIEHLSWDQGYWLRRLNCLTRLSKTIDNCDVSIDATEGKAGPGISDDIQPASELSQSELSLSESSPSGSSPSGSSPSGSSPSGSSQCGPASSGPASSGPASSGPSPSGSSPSCASIDYIDIVPPVTDNGVSAIDKCAFSEYAIFPGSHDKLLHSCNLQAETSYPFVTEGEDDLNSSRDSLPCLSVTTPRKNFTVGDSTRNEASILLMSTHKDELHIEDVDGLHDPGNSVDNQPPRRTHSNCASIADNAISPAHICVVSCVPKYIVNENAIFPGQPNELSMKAQTEINLSSATSSAETSTPMIDMSSSSGDLRPLPGLLGTTASRTLKFDGQFHVESISRPKMQVYKCGEDRLHPEDSCNTTSELTSRPSSLYNQPFLESADKFWKAETNTEETCVPQPTRMNQVGAPRTLWSLSKSPVTSQDLNSAIKTSHQCLNSYDVVSNVRCCSVNALVSCFYPFQSRSQAAQNIVKRKADVLHTPEWSCSTDQFLRDYREPPDCSSRFADYDSSSDELKLLPEPKMDVEHAKRKPSEPDLHVCDTVQLEEMSMDQSTEGSAEEVLHGTRTTIRMPSDYNVSSDSHFNDNCELLNYSGSQKLFGFAQPLELIGSSVKCSPFVAYVSGPSHENECQPKTLKHVNAAKHPARLDDDEACDGCEADLLKVDLMLGSEPKKYGMVDSGMGYDHQLQPSRPDVQALMTEWWKENIDRIKQLYDRDKPKKTNGQQQWLDKVPMSTQLCEMGPKLTVIHKTDRMRNPDVFGQILPYRSLLILLKGEGTIHTIHHDSTLQLIHRHGHVTRHIFDSTSPPNDPAPPSGMMVPAATFQHHFRRSQHRRAPQSEWLSWIKD